MLGKLKRQARLWMLSSTARAVRRHNLTMLGVSKIHRLEKTTRAVLRAGVPGACVEFGMALGGSGIIIARLAELHAREFHGFDVFGMIPPPSSEKDDSKSKQRYFEIISGQSKGINGETYYGYVENLYERVKKSFQSYGLKVGYGNICLHAGLFEETVPKSLPDQICIAHIDCDWYEPTRFCLGESASRMSAGSAIIIDDYHNYGGSRTATDEFLSSRADFVLEDGDNVVLRKR